MGDGLQDFNLSFEQLYEQARKSVPMVRSLGKRILFDLQTSYTGLFDDTKFESGDLKEWDRAIEKIRDDYDGNHAKICDLARGRIIVDTLEQIGALMKYVTFMVIQPKDQI